MLMVSPEDSLCLSFLIKQWYKELPSRILSGLNLNAFRVENATTLSGSLPEPKRSLFLWLIDLLMEVLKEKDSNKTNSMQLASILAPSLIEMKSTDDSHNLVLVEQAACLLYFNIASKAGEAVNSTPKYDRSELLKLMKFD